ncbi:BQ2448_1343 [Microbotryum intermedium]|uniref:BQ2448_1343 protein n=1 Tax=Microbotryum intermedium TaxID=269621 RepID=A0A238FAZ2_9BASI|nr:BQ2448_1343 [Microbotryum intermedium]
MSSALDGDAFPLLSSHANANTTNDTPAGTSSSTAAADTSASASLAQSAPLSAAQRMQQAHASGTSSAVQAAKPQNAILTEDPFPPEKLMVDDPYPSLWGPSVGAGAVTGAGAGGVSTDASGLPSAATAQTRSTKKALDVSDESAFPSLGGLAAAPRAVSAASWGGGGGTAAQRLQATATNGSSEVSRSATPASALHQQNGSDESRSAATGAPIATATVQLAQSEIHIQAPSGPGAGRGRGQTFSNAREVDPTTLGEVMKLLMKRNPTVTVEASTVRGTTTFIIKGKGSKADDDVAKVKRDLLARLAKKVSIEIKVPASTRGFIVGAKGRTLKSITDSTGANVQLPNRDAIQDANEAAHDNTNDASEGPDGPLIAITISGDSNAVEEARQQVMAIVSERVSKVTTKLDSVPKEFWELLRGSKGSKINAIIESVGATGSVNVSIPRNFERRGVAASSGADAEDKSEPAMERAISINGEREAVAKVVAAVEAEVALLERSTTTVSIKINKRQHRFLVGATADAILEEAECSIDLPPAESPDDNITLRGTSENLIRAFGLVMQKASATPIESLDLLTAHAGTHDRKVYASHLARYVLRRGKFRALSDANHVQIFLPRQAAIERGDAQLEIVGQDKEGVYAARQAVIDIVRKLPPAAFAVVEVDSLIHRHVIGKGGKTIKSLEEKRGVEVIFPPDGEDRSDILLVSASAASPAAAAEALRAAREEILGLAKDAADIQVETISIPASLHGTVIGKDGTTLNAVIGEEKLVNVRFGSTGLKDAGKANDASQKEDNAVVIRGPSEEVNRVKKELERIAEDAKNQEIVNSYIVEFEMDTVHVRHIVGKAGAGVNKLREDLGVRVDIEELGGANAAATPSAAPKKKTATGSSSRSKITIKGRKENVEEAKRRIQSLVTKIADEVTLTLTIPPSLDRGSLIGKQGAYLKRLEDKYEVRINFPRNNRGDDDDASSGKSNEVTVRGPKKGAAAAKGELVALIAYEQENGNVVTFNVSTRSLPRILGKAGASVNQIRDDTGVQSIDVDQQGDDTPTATITLRGTKAATKAAQCAIVAIAKEVDDEARFTLEIPRVFHTTLIGSGGSSIRELIAKAGGPTDARASGNTVRFPRQGEADDKVTITAPKAVAERIRAALEKEVANLKSRVVWGVVVPQSAHASIIGKGASALQEFQRKHGVKVVMPGWKDYAEAGEIENAADVADAAQNDTVKIVGPKETAVAAAAELSRLRTSASSAAVKLTVLVPKRHHAQIAQGGRFFRTLPSGTRVTHDGVKPPSSSGKSKKLPTPTGNSAAASARIDDDEGATEAAVRFELLSLHDEGESDGKSEIPWVIESSSQEDADKVAADIRKLLDQSDKATHVAWVTVPRGSMPRIVGRGGSGLDKLRAFGVEIEVVGKRDANRKEPLSLFAFSRSQLISTSSTIPELTLIGTPATIEQAHQHIVECAAPRPPRQHRNREDDY